MAAKLRTVKWQNTRIINTKKKYSGESSPYGEWAQKHNKKEEGETKEVPEANPDILVEPDEPVENLTRKIIKRDWREIKFSKREQEVLKEIAAGNTQDSIAKRLGISRSRVAQIIIRVQKKGAKWYGNKVANNTTYSAEEEQE